MSATISRQGATIVTHHTHLVPYTVVIHSDLNERLCPIHCDYLKLIGKVSKERDENNKLPTVGVAVPKVEIEVLPEYLMPMMLAAIRDERKLIIREMLLEYSAAYPTDAITHCEIDPDSLTLEAVALHHKARNNGVGTGGGKLSKDAVKNWFDTMMSETLKLRLSKRGDLPSAMIVKAVNYHRDMFASLAAPSPNMKVTDAEKLLRLIEKVQSDDLVKEKLIKQLQKILKPVEDDTDGLMDIADMMGEED